MIKTSTTQKVTFGATIILGLCIFAYVFMSKHVEDQRQKLQEVRADIVVADKLAENRQNTLLLLSETQQGREELSRYFVPTQDPTSFLELMESSAKDAGVIMKVETLSEIPMEASEGNMKTVKVVLVVEGAWQNVYHFMVLLELMPYAVSVTDSAFNVDTLKDVEVWKGQIQLQYRAK